MYAVSNYFEDSWLYHFQSDGIHNSEVDQELSTRFKTNSIHIKNVVNTIGRHILNRYLKWFLLNETMQIMNAFINSSKGNK